MYISKKFSLYVTSIIIIALFITCMWAVADGPSGIIAPPQVSMPTVVSPTSSGVVTITPPVLSNQQISSPIVSIPDECSCCNNSLSAEDIMTVRDVEEVTNEVNALNQEIKENGWDWVAGPTSVMFKSAAYRENLRGLKHQLTPEAVSLPVSSELTADAVTTLPTSFDWRTKGGKNWLTPVRDQGYCGSCWAFAVTGAFESYWERMKNNPNLNPNFAEQLLVSCARDQYGCNGGYFNAIKYFVNTKIGGAIGTVTETAYPYKARDSSCKSLSGVTRYKVKTGGKWGYVAGSEWSIPSVNALKTAIYKYGPIAAGVYADSRFDSYVSGIYGTRKTSTSTWANHAVLIVGWGTYNGKTYWIAKNSWGTGWGLNGYFKIYAGYNQIGEGAVYLTPP